MKLTLEDIAKHVKDLEDVNKELLAACEALVGLSGVACTCKRGAIGTRPCPVCLSEMAGLAAIAKAKAVLP